jgi:deoxyribodipyrimidine photo-lyase
MTTLVWFRQDLRLEDNAALSAAVAMGEPVVPVFVFAPHEEGAFGCGGAARWWLHQSLERLDEQLRARGARLVLRRAEATGTALAQLLRETGARRVFWNRRYEPLSIMRDREIKATLIAQGCRAESYNSALLHEPWTVATKSAGPFQVFTPFWRHCLSLEDPPPPLAAPERLKGPEAWPASEPLADLALLPRIDWTRGIAACWSPGSAAALEALAQFLGEVFEGYADSREIPGVRGTSRLSPHLHWGEIGPRQIWHETRRRALERGQHSTWRDSRFLTELGWREFAHHLLYHFPKTPQEPLRANFTRFPWVSDAQGLRAWQKGATGYPIVDAGMRELWRTGWMHNRVRMIVGSFLVKDLLIPWIEGARWFWDTLVDADLANNTLGWQWVAGCGADAAPFFRIFNPVSQATKFDHDGTYVRRWVPELAGLPNEWLHQPWAAPRSALADAGVTLGVSYPERVVDHDQARKAALSAFATLKS